MKDRLIMYSSWERSKNEGFLSVLERNPSARVVDLGCGGGEFSVRVRERVGCGEVWGVDVCDDCLVEAGKRGVLVRKVDLNGVLPFEAGSFDVVVSNQVIEHLFYPVRFLGEVFRVLKVGGYAVVSTENLSSWDNVVALVLGCTPFSMEFDSGLRKIGNPFSPHDGKVKGDYVQSHVRVFAWNGLVELARFSGFKVERVLGGGHFLGRFGEVVDGKHCRFITVKLRKAEDERE